jgi:two-component system sensor histidine kinase UhpB
LRITAHLTAIRNKGYSVRAYLVGLVAITLIPALLFGGWLTSRSAHSERELMEQHSESKAQQVVIDIDHEISSAKAMLTALASSQFLQIDDFEAFHRQSTDVAQQLGSQIVLRDTATGQVIVDAAVPWGQPLPNEVPPQATDAMLESIRTGKAAVSDVFLDSVVNKLVVSVGIPVKRKDGPAYYLAVGIPVDIFADALKNAALPDRWVISLVDRENTIVARSERHREFAGHKLILAIAGRTAASEGIVEGPNRDGIVFRWTWRRFEAMGWYVSVGVPLSLLEAPARSALTKYAAASGMLFAVAMALSFYLGDRLSQSVGTLGIDRQPTREEFRILFEASPNGVLVVDSQGLMALANPQMEHKFGYAQDELIGHPVEILLPGRFRGGHPALRRGYLANPESRAMGAGQELFGLRKDGSEFPIEIGLNPITTRGGIFVMATVVDITARVQSEKSLTAAFVERDDLRRRFVQAQENERLRLAHDLHDQTGQSLMAAMLELKALESLLSDEGRHRARALRGSMEQMGRTIHRIAWELRPASIDELGLTSALATYVSEWSRQSGIEVDFHCRDARLDSVADEKRTAIYRIVQEGLTNVAKHADDATSVSVVVDRSDATLRLTIEDDGRGYEQLAANPADAARNKSGLGHAGMRERLAMIGGELEIESSLGVGTTVFARIPLGNESLGI